MHPYSQFAKMYDKIGFQLLSEPDNFNSQKCGAINKGDTQWSSANCDNSKGFLCRFKSSKHYIVFNLSPTIMKPKDNFKSQVITFLVLLAGQNGTIIVTCYNPKSPPWFLMQLNKDVLTGEVIWPP